MHCYRPRLTSQNRYKGGKPLPSQHTGFAVTKLTTSQVVLHKLAYATQNVASTEKSRFTSDLSCNRKKWEIDINEYYRGGFDTAVG